MGYRKPVRIFEDSGFVNKANAYYVDLENVVNTRKQGLKTMVDQGRYFSIFAPRQSGKTTFFDNFCRELEKDSAYAPIQLSFQDYMSLDSPRFYQLIQKYLYRQLIKRLDVVKCPQREAVNQFLSNHILADHISFRELFEDLNSILQSKKIVIFIDEFDGIPRPELANFLTALRELYQQFKNQKDKALYSVGLVGIRNIPKLIVGGVSPFNIADQVNLPPFTFKNVRDLYEQYTEETNQPFSEEAVRKVYEETGGQPWLVNRLGTILTVHIKPETTEPLSAKDVEKAIDILLYEENSHFDNITEKAMQYKESFIDVVFDGVELIPGDEQQSQLLTHGLIKAGGKELHVNNPIYKIRFTRTFFRDASEKIDASSGRYYLPDSGLNMGQVLSDFEKYIAQIGAAAFYSTKKPMEVTGKFQLTAWLYQFVAKSDGQLHYESRTGLGIMDIMLIRGHTRYIIETKINRYTGTLDDALEQLAERYLLPERVDHGYIVLFDPKTRVGELCTPRIHRMQDKEIMSYNIGIGR